MESGARAVEAELLQPQTGRPVTKHCTAQGLTTTTATGIDIRNTASVITPQTLLNTVSIAAFTPCRPTPSLKSVLFLRVKGFNGELCFIPMQRGYFPCADSPEVFGEACRGGRYESNTQRCGFFLTKSTQQTSTFIVLSSGWNVRPPPICSCLTSAICAQDFIYLFFAAVIMGAFSKAR